MADDVEYNDTDLKYLGVLINNPDPVYTAVEVADMLDVTQQAAHDRLSRLEGKKIVFKKTVGANAVVWWPSPKGVEIYRESSS